MRGSFFIRQLGKNDEGLGSGYLYNWYAASDANFAPTDWKFPTDAEYVVLRDYLGGGVSGNVTGELKASGLNNWASPNTGANNSTGFTWLPNGYRKNDGTFGYLTYRGYFWTSDNFSTNANLRYALYNSTFFTGATLSQKYGAAIRLLYTGAGTPSTVTDNDGNVYDVVLIGTQRWTVQNWKCTTLDNGTALTKVTNAAAWAALTTEGYCAYDNDEGNV